MTEKVCTGCGEPQPLDAFARSSRNADGRQSRCRGCARRWYADGGHEKLRAAERTRYHADLDASRARNRAADRSPRRAATRRASRRRRYASDAAFRARARERSARTRGGGGAPAAWADVLLADPCAYCGDASEHVDHVEPLALGGEHATSNLIGACSACNVTKGAARLLPFLLRRKEAVA